MAKPKVKKGCLIALLLALLLIGGVVFMVVKTAKTIQQTMSVPYGEVTVKDLSDYVNVSGTVSSSNTVNVTSSLNQKVVKLNVKVGDSVKKGDVLCELDASELQETYDQLQQTMNQADSAKNYKDNVLQRNLNTARNERNDLINKAQDAINKATAARDTAYQAYNASVDRYNQLLNDLRTAEAAAQTDPNAAARAQELSAQADALYEANQEALAKLPELDNAITAARDAYDDARKRGDELVQGAQDAVDSENYTAKDNESQNKLEKLAEQIADCVITAPEDGVVTELNIAEGSIPTSATLMVIENTDSLIIRGKVNESDILRIEENLPCEIKTTATEDETVKGSVKRIERIVSSNTDASLSGYTVEISIDDKDSKLLIGMSANVKIVIDSKDKVLSVPYDALLGNETDGFFVYQLAPDKEGTVKVVKKTVKKGFEGDYYTEVTDTDLKEGDIVYTAESGSVPMTEGMVLPDPRLLEGLNSTEDSQA